MKKAIFLVTILLAFLLSSCTELPNDNTPDDQKQNQDEDVCDVGFNEVLDKCALPVLSDDSFADISLSIDDSYNMASNKMISNLLYNHFTETLEFDLEFKSDLFIESVNLTVIDEDGCQVIWTQNLLFEYEYVDSETADVAINDHIYLTELAPGTSYIVKIAYDYSENLRTVYKQTGTLATFRLDASRYDDVSAPELVEYELLSSTTDSLEISFQVWHQDITIDSLEIRLYDSFTGEYTGITKQIENLDQYREEMQIRVPSILIEGLKSNVYYDIKLFGSGHNDVDTFKHIALVLDESMNYQLTEKLEYEITSTFFFRFELLGLDQEQDGVLLSYQFVDEREQYQEFLHHREPVYLRVENRLGDELYEVELDTSLTEVQIPQTTFDNGYSIHVYYQISNTNQYVTLAMWNVDLIPVEE